MSAPIHPSSEELSAYLDQELSPDRQESIAAHLPDCPECRAVVEQFELLAAMGPVVEESLPGDAYWLDLPDRILARIAAEQNAPVAAPAEPARPSLWQRLWNPQGAMRWAMATAAAVVVVGGAWTALHQPRNPVSPVNGDLAEVRPTTAAPTTDFAENIADGGDDATSPTMNPESFTRRVIVTLGGENNLGTSLDLQPGSAISGQGDPSGLGNQVDYTLPALGPQARAEAQGVVSCGPGETAIERAFVAAAKAEEMGNLALARQGYRVVTHYADPSHPIFWEADFRLTYCSWRQRLLMAPPGPARAKALAELDRVAAQAYQTWAQSGERGDCQEAWCLNRTMLRLGAEATGDVEQQQTTSRMNDLMDCMNK
jgi:hypothetical protein